MTRVVRALGSLCGRALRCSALVAILAAFACRVGDPLESVRELQAAGQWESAAEELRALLDSDPESADLNLAYGQCLLQLQDPSRAVWPLRKAAESEAHAVDAGLLLSQALLQTSNPQEAAAAASAVLERDPGQQAALQLRARALLAAKQEEQALADADRLLALHPDDQEALLARLTALLVLTRVDEAEAAIRSARERFVGREDASAELRARFCMIEAVFAWEKGEVQRGETQLADCVDRFPDEPVAVAKAVEFYDASGRVERATEILRRAAERAAHELEFQGVLAQRLRKLGLAAEAEQVLLRATQNIDGHVPWLALHDHYAAVENYAAARSAIEQAFERMQETPPPLLELAHAEDLVLAGDRARASEIAARLEPPASNIIRGRIHLIEGRAAQALLELEAGLRLWPDNAAVRWLAGQAAEQVGDFARAVSHYRDSVRKDPALTDAAYRLATLCDQIGAVRDAIDFAQRHAHAHTPDPKGQLLLIELGRRHVIPALEDAGLRGLARMPGQQARALAERARTRALRDGPKAGLAALAAALAAHPDSADLHALHGELLERAGSAGEAIRSAYAQALALAPENTSALLGLARLEVLAGNSSAAIALYDRVPDAAPDAASARLAALHLVDTNAETAVLEGRLETLLAAHPRSAEAAEELADSLAARGAEPERVAALRRRASLLRGGAAESLAATPDAQTPGRDAARSGGS